MNRTKIVSRNIIFGIINKTAAVVIPFITRTIMIYKMGMQYVGLGSLFTSVLSVLSIAELGIGTALVFSMYKPIAEGNASKVCALLNLYRKTYRIIGSIIFFAGLMILPFIDILIADSVPRDINIYYLYFIYLVNNVLGYFLYAYKQSLFVASQRVDKISLVNFFSQLVLGGIQIYVLIVFKNYYMYVLAIPLITCMSNIIIAFLAKKYFAQYKCVGDLEKHELEEIKKKIEGMFFQKIGGIVLYSVDAIVISSFLGLISLAKYQNYYFVVNSLNGFLSIIMSSIIPSVGNSIVTENVNKNYMDFKKLNFIYTWIVVWWSACLVVLYQPFMELWVKKSNMLSNGTAFLFALYFFVHKWCDMLYVYQEASGLWWETRYIPFLAAIVNFVVNIVLVQSIGLPGILISTIVAILLIYDTGYARKLFKTFFREIGKGLYNFWKRQVLYFLTAICAISANLFLCNMFSVDLVFAKLLVNLFISLVVPNVVLYMLLHSLSEYKGAKNLLLNIVNRKIFDNEKMAKKN